jgi:poly(3-hydroxybutyrate) depolymerase
MAGGRWLAAIIGLLWGGMSVAQPLPRLNAAIDEWTVSGLSSGGYMASQIAVAHSRRVRGVGVFAGGPYYCVGTDPRRAEGECMKGAPDPAASRRQAERLATMKLIDGVDNLKRTRSWVLAGEQDRTVLEPVVKAASRFFATFNPGAAAYGVQSGLGHGLPTAAFGVACDASAAPYLNNCGSNLVEQMLGHLLPDAKPGNWTDGRVIAFAQREFIPAWRRMWNTTSLHEIGYAFVPARCEQANRCRVHVALHGCRQGAGIVGDAFVRHAGYNDWAVAHDTIVLYPQVAASQPGMATAWLPYNPRGCWDWWGYTGTDYATKTGVQIAAIVAMVERLGQKR